MSKVRVMNVRTKLPVATRETKRNCSICYKGKKTYPASPDFVGVTRLEDGQSFWIKIWKEMRPDGEICLRVELQPKEER